MRIVKFGGTSISTVNRIKNVRKIIRNSAEKSQIIVVISALGGVTNQLIASIEQALRGDLEWQKTVGTLIKRHYDVLKETINFDFQEEAKIRLDYQFNLIESFLKEVSQSKNCSPALSDKIISIGEYLSVSLMVAGLQTIGLKAIPINATELIQTDDNYGEARVDFPVSNKKIKNKFKDWGEGLIPVVTGFIGSTCEGNITTLGRNGSDYTATILGAALNAEQVEIWSDTDGILTADPAILTDAVSLPQITFGEAEALAQVGAGILHPRTIEPLYRSGVPAVIKNTFQPEFTGTYVKPDSKDTTQTAKIVTSLPNTSMLSIEVKDPETLPKVSESLLNIFAQSEILPLLVSNCSHSHSLNIVIRNQQMSKALDLLYYEFKLELDTGSIKKVKVEKDTSVVSIIGQNIHENPTRPKKLIDLLKKQKMKIFASSNGYFQHISSVAIETPRTLKALSVLHKDIILPESEKELNLLVKDGTIKQ